MIVRPLELASKLRPEPRSLDGLFFVNAGLLVLFFMLFGSRFVVAPGLRVELPQIPDARAGVARATHHITVTGSGTIFINAGPVSQGELKTWLAAEGQAWRAEPGNRNYRPSLLVRADAGVPVKKLAEITSAAGAAGFSVRFAALEEAGGGTGIGR